MPRLLNIFLLLLLMCWIGYTIIDVWKPLGSVLYLQVQGGMSERVWGQKSNISELPVQKISTSVKPLQVKAPAEEHLQVKAPAEEHLQVKAPAEEHLQVKAPAEELDRALNLSSDCFDPPKAGEKRTDNLWSPLSTSETFLIPYLRRNGLRAREGLGRRRELLDMFSIEAALLCSPPLTDPVLLPHESTSKVRIIGQRSGYKVGDRIQFRVDLYDGRGVIRTGGGDEVRMWLISPNKHNSIPARVYDHHNGSYSGVTVLKWPGVTLVRVALTYPREFLRLLVELRHTLHSLHWVTGIFVNGQGTKEGTPCLPTPPIPGYATACNLTAKNGGSPWYCGTPRHPLLTCRDWNLTGNLDFLAPLPLPEKEKQMVHRIDSRPFIKLIPNNITVLTGEATTPSRLAPPPCWKKPREESWTSETPRGWVEKGVWQAQGCSLPLLTAANVTKCLRDTGFLLVGDSNQGLFLNELRIMMGLDKENCKRPSQSVSHCELPGGNSSLVFIPHSKPFNVGTHAGKDLRTHSLSEAIAMLLSQNHANNVVVVHYYVHNSFYPLHMYRMRVQYARRVIEKALDAHPEMKVIIRGPHVIYRGKQHHAQFGDNFGPQYTQIWKEEFRELYHKVWFLDLWDLSIAMENMTSHPPRKIVLQMIRALFGNFCEL